MYKLFLLSVVNHTGRLLRLIIILKDLGEYAQGHFTRNTRAQKNI